MIYAQTVIQLDGDVINRYSQEIFDHPHREVILQIHREGVTLVKNSGADCWSLSLVWCKRRFNGVLARICCPGLHRNKKGKDRVFLSCGILLTNTTFPEGFRQARSEFRAIHQS
jgi:hypothetical protein